MRDQTPEQRPDLTSRLSRTSHRPSACDPRSLRSFIWPLIAPPGAGLLVWEGDGGGGARERRIVYEPGSMYVFRGSVVHAWAPWPYRSAYRVNLQAFAVRCGERWYVYH